MPNTSANVSPLDTSLIDGLQHADAFAHPVDTIDLVETHISWVILAGGYAYKIKKPIVLDFVDFGDLEKRRHCCEEEIRLNKPSAPGIYLDVVPITGNGDRFRFGGDGEVLEYAVRMRQFDQDLRLDRQLAADRLTVADMKELGQNIAKRHAGADIPDTTQRERLIERARFYIWENFDHLQGFVDDQDVKFLHDWTERELVRIGNLMLQRFDDGFIRDCHGDLHLANLVRLPDGITTFDCIEFNADLRNIDVMCDVAFLTMDLVEKSRHDLASLFLNRYLEASGDYGGIVLLDLYFVYRCLVRAKVAAILGREREPGPKRDANLAEAMQYCDLARRQAGKDARALIIMSGVSGSGKTWLSERLMAELPAIRLRSDIERKRLFGLAETERSGSGVGSGMYADNASEATYARILEHARAILTAKHHVILDAAFLKSAQRDRVRQLAAEVGCAFILLRVEAPVEELRARLRRRESSADEASEANLAVLEHQLATSDSLSPVEEASTIVVDSTDPDLPGLLRSIRHRIGFAPSGLPGD